MQDSAGIRNMSVVAPVFKGATINKKIRLAHDSLRRPETVS